MPNDRSPEVPAALTTAHSDDLAGVDDILAPLSRDRRELFALRVERWWPDLVEPLAALYPGEAARDLSGRVLAMAARAYAARGEDLHRLDLRRTLAPDWFQEPSMLGYAAYADRFGGTLAGVCEQVDYLKELGVTYLHLMPLLTPRDGDNDGGYAVADYRSVRADLGTMDDLRSLTATLREAGISLVLDLVLNHVAREHAWAVAAREGDEHYRAYFHTFPDRSLPDAYEATLPEVFPDFAPGNFTWDDDLGAHVWTTFNSFQWDLDWTNPDVFAEFADLVLFLAGAGVEVLRLDAIAFLVKRMGTSCQNQPEVHSIVQALRALLRVACPGVLLKAEAIVAPDDLVHYLGQGVHHGKVSDLAYHNSLMVQAWSMLASQDVRLTARALAELPPVPTTTAWITYVRCHDDIGWAIDDGDAASVGLSGFDHRSFLSDWYSGQFPLSWARGLVFQANPATGDRRISGSTAALAGLVAAGQLTDAAAARDAQDAAIGRILLAHALISGWGGVPVLWMGDELGLPGDEHWADEPGHGGDNRWVHRPRMDAAAQRERHVDGTVEHRLFTGIAHIARVRASLPHLHASVPSTIVPPTDPGVLGVLRRHPRGDLLCLYNAADTWRRWPSRVLDELGLAGGFDHLSGMDVVLGGDGDLWLPPYAAMWVTGRGHAPGHRT